MRLRPLSVRRMASSASRRLKTLHNVSAAAIEGGRHSVQDGLLVFDDMFPHAYSGFRIAEFNAYLDVFPGSEVHSTGEAIPSIEPGGTFAAALRGYEAQYQAYRDRVRYYNPYRRLQPSLLYAIFVYNAWSLASIAERYSTPFVFGLYPGGGFQMNQLQSDRWLARIFSSPEFAGVIANQRTTVDYILDKGFCQKDKIHFIFGIPALDLTAFGAALPKKVRGVTKATFDLCFVAHKYTPHAPHGRDKGYDVFIEVGKRLVSLDDGVRLHVVGSWDASDWDLGPVQSKITFYGPQRSPFFREFYAGMDVILSPNVPFMAPGVFDGFPLTTCVEAARTGVAVCCTDELGENRCFENGKEILIVQGDPNEIASLLEHYMRNYDQLIALAERGRAKFAWLYNFENQIVPRVRVLASCGQRSVVPPEIPIREQQDRGVPHVFCSRPRLQRD